MKTKYETIIVDQEDGIAKITLNIPETLNAMTQKLGEEVVEAARDASEDSNVRVVILTGAGRGFCSGANLSTFGVAELGPLGTLIMARKLPETAMIFRAMPKPIMGRNESELIWKVALVAARAVLSMRPMSRTKMANAMISSMNWTPLGAPKRKRRRMRSRSRRAPDRVANWRRCWGRENR